MGTPGAGRARNRVQVRRLLPPGAVWAAALCAAPFLNDAGTSALIWGAGSAVLIALFPWALVTVLDRRGDLRRGIERLGAPPVILGGFGAAYVVLRIIQWTDGPRALAAVVFSLIAAYTLTRVLARAVPLDWGSVTYGAAAVVLPVLLYLLIPGAGSIAAAATVLVLCLAALLGSGRQTRGKTAAAAAAGVLAGGGVFLWLLSYSL